MPDTYRISEKFGGGGTSDPDVIPTLFALAMIVCVSGSYATPGQLVPPTAFPMLMAPRTPLTLPSTGGLYIHGATLLRSMVLIACARIYRVQSVTSSCTLSA